MATISGTVKNEAGNFAQRIVRAYRRSDGAFASQAVSDATTGAFSCAALDTSAHYVLTLDGEVAAEYDPYWNSVVLAMHMDDAGLTDLKGHAVTLTGNVARSSTQSKFGGYSAVFDGTGDYLTTPYVAADFNWWTGSFTLECWVFASSFSTWQHSDGTNLHAKLIGNSSTLSAHTYWSFGPLASGAVQFRYWNGSATNAVASTATVVSGQWNHIAFVFDGSKINIYVNGVGLATPVSVSGTPQASTSVPLALGVLNYQYLAGYVDDLRITKGVARYTANFTPPAAAFPHGLSIGAPTTNALIFDNITPV